MECLPDRVADGLGLEENIIVPKAEDLESLAPKMGVAFSIIVVIKMLTTVGFHNQAVIEVDKIGDGPVDYDLPFEFVTGKAFRSE